jgi:hypothetical protein
MARREIEKAGPGRDVGDVGDPELVRLFGREVAIDQVGRWPAPLVADRRAGEAPPADAGEAGRAHQALDPLAPDADAGFHEIGMDARGAIGPARAVVEGRDPLGKRGVGKRPRRRRPAAAGVKAAARHAERGAHRGDGKIGLVRGHEVEDLEDVTSL